jgi:oleate hydratase
MEAFTNNKAGTGGLVTFKDSRWLMSVVLAHQPHFANQPAGVYVFWGYALRPDRIGDFIAKPMSECSGTEILRELCGHLNFDFDTTFQTALCIPCRMPYITSMFMPRAKGDRPLPVPHAQRIWRSSASSSKSRMMSFSPSNIRCGRPKWRSRRCSTSSARYRQSCIMISRSR